MLVEDEDVGPLQAFGLMHCHHLDRTSHSKKMLSIGNSVAQSRTLISKDNEAKPLVPNLGFPFVVLGFRLSFIAPGLQANK